MNRPLEMSQGTSSKSNTKSTQKDRAATTATVTKPVTRATSKAPGGHPVAEQNKEDLFALSDREWARYTASDARDYLQKTGFMATNSPGVTSLESLVMALLRIAKKVNTVPEADACRAVAVILDKRRA